MKTIKTLIFAIRLILRPFCDTVAFIWLMGFLVIYLGGCATTSGYNPWAHVGDGLINASHQESSTRKQVYCNSYRASGQVYTTCQ